MQQYLSHWCRFSDDEEVEVAEVGLDSTPRDVWEWRQFNRPMFCTWPALSSREKKNFVIHRTYFYLQYPDISLKCCP